MNRKFKLKENFFDAIDDEEKAYFLGFLYADGCNNKGYVKLELNSKDKEILEKLSKIIFDDNEPHVKNYIRKRSDKEFSYSYISLNSKYLCEKLKELGCPPRKSLVLKFPDWLDDKLKKHFIRGYFDGDGSVSVQKVKGRSSTWKLISTKEFCESVNEILGKETGSNLTLSRELVDKNVFTIACSGNRKVKSILDWMYSGANIFMERKWKKYLEILTLIAESERLAELGARGYSKKRVAEKSATP